MTPKRSNVAVVIPTRNEPYGGLFDLFLDVSEYDIIQVDDSFPLQQIPIAGTELLHGPRNLIGSIQQGLNYAVWQGYDYIVVMDAGFSHDPAEIKTLIVPGFDLIIGSRFVSGGSHTGPLYRRWGSRLYGKLMGAFTGMPIRDWTSGFRCYSNRAATLAGEYPLHCTRHAGQAELLLNLLDSHRTYAEVPINYAPSRSSLNLRAVRESIGLLWRTATSIR